MLEVIANVPCVPRGIFRKFAWDSTVKSNTCWGAASQNDDYAGESKVVDASL